MTRAAQYWHALLCATAVVVCAAGARADDLNTEPALRAAVEVAGANRSEVAHHDVEINDCQMTTFVWKPWSGEGFKLWSSFVFDMRQTTWRAGPDKRIVIASDDRRSLTGEDGMVMVMFDMREGYLARHEVPDFRVHEKAEHRPSPRQAHVPFFYRPSTDFFYMHEGRGVVDKALRFTALYERYVAEYCTMIG